MDEEIVNAITWKNIIQLFKDDKTTKMEALSEVANRLMKEYYFKTTRDNEEIWVFTNPVYEKLGEQTIKKEMWSKLQGLIRQQDITQVIEQIKAMTYVERPEHYDWNLIPLQNGWYDIEKDELVEPDPSKFIINSLPIKYNPDADCPEIKKFVSEIVAEDDVPIVQEMIGYCLLKNYKWHKAFMLLGSGSNGKSTLLNLIKTFLGKKNCSTASLQDLCWNRFAEHELYGKLANIHADIPAGKLHQTGRFKMLTGEDTARGEQKYKKPFPFENYAKLLFSANELPGTNDVSDAFFRRWIIINFPYRFEGKNADKELLEKLTTEEELQGLFNWATEGLRRLIRQDGFSTSKTTQYIKDEWILRTDPLRAFVERYCTYDPNYETPKEEFNEKLSEFCDEHDISMPDSSVIGRKLPIILKGVKAKRKREGKDRYQVWKGLKIYHQTVGGSGWSGLIDKPKAHFGNNNKGLMNMKCETSIQNNPDHPDHSSDSSAPSDGDNSGKDSDKICAVDYDGLCVFGNHRTRIKYRIRDEEDGEWLDCCDAHIEEAKEVMGGE